MMWYGGGWCGQILNLLAVVALTGVVIAAVVLAVRVRGEGRSDPRDGGFARATQVGPLGARRDLGDDDPYRRLM